MGEVILVASGKGGTGKTMFSVNMGAMLARYGYRVMLIDMDMGLRNMDLYLGMEDRVIYNLMDVLSGLCRINKAMIKVEGFETLYFMAASPRKDDRDITPLHMKVLCDKLRGIFDYIIIDCRQAPAICWMSPWDRPTRRSSLQSLRSPLSETPTSQSVICRSTASMTRASSSTRWTWI